MATPKNPDRTNAVRVLVAAGIDHRLHVYDAEDGEIDAPSVARKIGVDPTRLFKTLVVRTDDGRVAVFCLPGVTELSLKKAARVLGARSVRLAPVAELRDLTGYVRGGCSPIGLKRPFPIYLDETAALHERIVVSAGRIGLQVELTPADLATVASAVSVDITAP